MALELETASGPYCFRRSQCQSAAIPRCRSLRLRQSTIETAGHPVSSVPAPDRQPQLPERLRRSGIQLLKRSASASALSEAEAAAGEESPVRSDAAFSVERRASCSARNAWRSGGTSKSMIMGSSVVASAFCRHGVVAHRVICFCNGVGGCCKCNRFWREQCHTDECRGNEPRQTGRGLGS